MGFFHCKIDPGKKIPIAFQHKVAKKFPSAANQETDTKCWQDEQKWSGFVQKRMTRSSKNVAESDPGNQWKKIDKKKKSLAPPGQSQPHRSHTPSAPAGWRRPSTNFEPARANAAEQSQASSPSSVDAAPSPVPLQSPAHPKLLAAPW